MKIYLAGRYPRREELLGYSKVLEAAGHEITARWLIGKEEGLDYQDIALLDVEDVQRADTVMSFTENPKEGTPRGGRHVEFGLGLGLGKQCITIGERENVFHFFPTVRVYKTLEDFLNDKEDLLDRLPEEQKRPGGSLATEGLTATVGNL